MSPRPSVYLAGAAFALYAAAGAAAFAQPLPPPPPPGAQSDHGDRPEHRMMMRGGDHHGMRFERGGEGPEQRAAHLRAILQLKPGQEGALITYLAAMKPSERD